MTATKLKKTQDICYKPPISRKARSDMLSEIDVCHNKSALVTGNLSCPLSWHLSWPVYRWSSSHTLCLSSKTELKVYWTPVRTIRGPFVLSATTDCLVTEMVANPSGNGSGDMSCHADLLKVLVMSLYNPNKLSEPFQNFDRMTNMGQNLPSQFQCSSRKKKNNRSDDAW